MCANCEEICTNEEVAEKISKRRNTLGHRLQEAKLGTLVCVWLVGRGSGSKEKGFWRGPHRVLICDAGLDFASAGVRRVGVS